MLNAQTVSCQPVCLCPVGSVRQRLRELIRSTAGGGSGGSGRTDGMNGWSAALANVAGSVQHTGSADVVVTCWAEVWCGSAETGRWVHVDVVNGLVDRCGVDGWSGRSLGGGLQ